MTVNYIPKGYHTITPYVVVKGAQRLIDFMKKAFDAQQVEFMEGPNGSVRHAEMKIGDSIIMLADAPADHALVLPYLYIYVPDTDKTYTMAIEAGAASLREPEDMFYGDRNAGVKDPVGGSWWIATHKEDLTPEEMQRREQLKK